MELGHFIGGRLRPGRDGVMTLHEPATGKALLEVPLGDNSTVDEAVAAAHDALTSWRRTLPAERAAVLLRLADAVEAHTELFAQVESLNVGKPLAVSREEIAVAADSLRFMAGAARTAQTPAAGEYVRGHMSMIRREPVGVVGAITPWNYPLMMAIWKLAPALAAGNTVVLKPAELTPLSTLLLTELTREILPPGVVNIVLGTGSVVGAALSRHPGIAMMSLTGSVASGKAVADAASDTLKRVHLELGGKAPVVVFDDADLDEVVESLKVMGYWNTGQECGAATRVLCDAAVHNALVAKLAVAVSSLAVGAPEDGEDIEMGPLISERQLERVAGMVSRAAADGAAIVAGGARIDRPGFFYAPTVITDVPAGSEIAREEVFGPVVTVQSFTSEAEAVAMANDVPYGLAASVWTENASRSLRVSDDLDFGTVWINSHLTLAAEMPWGGFGLSGYGRDMSAYALDDFTRTKHVMVNKRYAA
ncbi:aminobutyraldehyde dehydrogenase [Streptomyces samsunensis]|uniref:aminobutyraldehyde dehydrogenase n=1 Tax=Streptomyces malaysiensis TaxID=92644 RepID=UPI001583D1D1|nr:aminobutyraldehyde dehydrogenase [Streptomyces samsunensis]